MVENPHNDSSPCALRVHASGATATVRGAPERRTAAPAAVAPDHDPVTDWLLERADLDGAELSVLFAIHKFRTRPGRAGWIGHNELCRSTGLGPAELGGVLTELCRRGLLGRVRHPMKTGCARYLLVASSGAE